jgi:hypothetical protein
VSGEIEGARHDLRSLTEAGAAEPADVPHARALLALADAVVDGGEARLAPAREAALAALGPEAFVAAAAVAGNFERMDRIADATGVELDAALGAITGGLRAELGLDAFASAANTPRPPLWLRLAGRALAPFARYAMPAAARLSRRAPHAQAARKSS